MAANTGVSIGESSAALAKLKAESKESDSDKLFYIVDDFSKLKTVPGFSFGAPSGLVSGWGVGFAALSGSHKDSDTDGAAAFGFGYGDPFESLGGSASLSIGSINPSDGGACNRGALNLNLGHTFRDYQMGIAAGISNIDLWHASQDLEVDESYYLAATKILPFDVNPMIVSVGFGNEDFVNINTDDDRDSKISPFFSGAVYIHPQMSLILDYTSNITTFATSIVPCPDYPVSINLGLTDIFKQADEDAIGFVASIAVGFSF
jgi:hypothetical protein